MSNLVDIKSFEVHNTTVGTGATEEVLLANADITPRGPAGPANRSVSADGMMITAIGEIGKSIGIRIDSDTSEFFQVTTGTTILIRVPIKRKVTFNNTSDAAIKVSVAFLRGRNHF